MSIIIVLNCVENEHKFIHPLVYEMRGRGTVDLCENKLFTFTFINLVDNFIQSYLQLRITQT